MKDTTKDEPKQEEPKQAPVKKVRLTAADLQKNEDIISASEQEQKETAVQNVAAPPPKPVSAKKGAKPLWAKTQDELVNEEEGEIDDLIDFAYDLDYEKYIEDLEVRQALALIKD